MRGLSANVMCGQEGFFGTGAFQVVLDMEQMLKLKKEVKIDNMTDKEKIDREFGLGTVDDACGTENIVISNNVSAIAGADMGEIDDSYDMGF
jgi:DNA-directed RNA polymerase II subunit RPB1